MHICNTFCCGLETMLHLLLGDWHLQPDLNEVAFAVRFSDGLVLDAA